MAVITFHSLICMLEWIFTAGIFLYGGVFNKEKWDICWRWGLGLLFAFPTINELFLTLKGFLFKLRIRSPPNLKMQNKVPIVFAP